MSLGYVPDVEDVLEYYARPDVADALSLAARGRTCEFYFQPTRFDLFERSTDPDALPTLLSGEIRRYLAARWGPLTPHYPLTRYPGLHGTVERDIVLEVDDKTSQHAAHEGGKHIRDFLESRRLPYRVKFSGNCSMHFILPRATYQPFIPENRGNDAFPFLFRWFNDQLRAAVEGKLDGSFVEPDHFLRLPYSLNEWTGLVSLLIRPEEYDRFDLQQARIENVEVSTDWLSNGSLRGEANGWEPLMEEVFGGE